MGYTRIEGGYPQSQGFDALQRRNKKRAAMHRISDRMNHNANHSTNIHAIAKEGRKVP